ncbi:nucleoside triphosphate pyrophosphohydrolase [Amorphus orientalis]|uniref:Nucleoside triphosphate pyrophosphohydrolase n=1 Tax=Amorphus orientalis TaxID=649198 RepID=A0AAE3VPI5_9HYPH|nr:nucleoside triphosphate pyrophosphohydrolase [Amorphus orientalis]MDQ0315863.1 ATP diphosphatase [Amorphus orientalis]
MTPSRDIATLLAIMARLRDPDTGCPWDVKQSFETIVPYTIEEAYEVADAVQQGDREDLRDELGDLLLQVVFHAQMADEEGAFDFGGVVEAITEKLVRRHPHVFGDARDLPPERVKALWDEIKAEEKRLKAERSPQTGQVSSSSLDGVPLALPALTRAEKLQKKAAKVGFDWGAPAPVIAKIREEIEELEAEIEAGPPAQQRIGEEIGDLLFAVANLARHLDVDPEAALRGTNEKFRRRFTHIETALADDGRRPEDATLEEMEAHWQAAKARERAD